MRKNWRRLKLQQSKTMSTKNTPKTSTSGNVWIPKPKPSIGSLLDARNKALPRRKTSLPLAPFAMMPAAAQAGPDIVSVREERFFEQFPGDPEASVSIIFSVTQRAGTVLTLERSRDGGATWEPNVGDSAGVGMDQITDLSYGVQRFEDRDQQGNYIDGLQFRANES